VRFISCSYESFSHGLLIGAVLILLSTHATLLLSLWETNIGFIDLVHRFHTLSDIPSSFSQCERLTDSPPGATHFERALQWDGENGEALIGLGLSEWLAGQCDLAWAKWRRAPQLDPRNRRFWFYAGHGYFAVDEKDAAIDAFRRAGAGHYLYKQGRRAELEANPQEALKWFEVAAQVAPDVLTLDRLAYLYKSFNQREKAVAALQRFAAQSPEGSDQYWWAVGQAAILNEDLEAAIFAFRQGTTTESNQIDFYMLIGDTLEKKGALGEALDAYRQSTRLHPENIYAYIALGQVAVKLGRRGEARQAYERAGVIDPNSELPDLHLGILALEEQRYDLAEWHLFRARSKNPRNRLVLYHIALCFYHQGDARSAIDYLKQAVEPSPLTPYWWVTLGEWYTEVGNSTEAMNAYREALSLMPGNTLVMQRIQELKEDMGE